MSKLTIHIGLHKTGTTYLQQVFFRQIPSITLIRGWESHRKILSAGLDKQLVISDEALSGNPWKEYQAGFEQNIEKLKRLYSDPRIVFGIRQQATLLPSLYRQFLQEKGFKPMNALFNAKNTGIIKHEDILLLPKIKQLQQNFSEVFIYSQESLKVREEDFAASFYDFMDIPSFLPQELLTEKQQRNVGVSTVFQVNALIKLNRISHRLENIHPALSLYSKFFRKLKITPRHICQKYLRKKKSEKFRISEGLEAFLEAHYEEDWQAAREHISY